MNCCHARQYISPYLDHQLTGREMLALQDHLAVCPSCEREMQSIRQVKSLLRGLRDPRLPRDFSHSMTLRLEQAESDAQSWGILWISAPRPQRGRRLATALALSCLTVLTFVAPFAPEPHGPARTASSMFGSGSQAFSAPVPTDVILSGRVPERITLIPVDDLVHLSPAESSGLPRGNVLLLTGLDSPSVQTSMQSSLGASLPRSQDTALNTVQFASFRPR